MCGVIIEGLFIPVENIADNPIDNFRFSEQDSALYSTADAIIHSHCQHRYSTDPRIPSYSDMVSAENSAIPYGIVHCDGSNVTSILWFNTKEIVPLLGREYISNVFDCFTLARDFFRLENNIDIGLHPRPEDWQEWDAMYIYNHFQDCRCTEKPSITKRGDIILLTLGSNLVNHIGIALDSTTFMHHLYNRVSCIDTVDKWKKHIKLILEFRG
jgi:cell wall-associated NlpC family hydrolase